MIKFDLKREFVQNYCIGKEGVEKCPFLESTGKNFKCLNFTEEGVLLHRKTRNEKLIFRQKGCDYVLIKILLFNKDFFVGKRVEYSDGSNTEDKKTFISFKYNRLKHHLIIYLKGERDLKPFTFHVNTDRLAISVLIDKIQISNKLGQGHSIDVFS